MFEGCSSLTSVDMSGLDTGNVTDMFELFCVCASLLSLDLSSLDTGKVVNMDGMFKDCSSLNELDLSGLDTGKVVTTNSMFLDCAGLESLDLSGLDMGNVTNVEDMLFGCENLQTIKTPKTMDAVTLELPGTYKCGAETTTYITKNHFTGVELHKVVEETPTQKPTDDQSNAPADTDHNAESAQLLESYVKRCYQIILGREADQAGLEDWVGRLSRGEAMGGQIVEGFVNSEEFTNRKTTDDEYVNILYRAMFDREADTDGYNDWLNQLNAGTTRQYVLKGFV